MSAPDGPPPNAILMPMLCGGLMQQCIRVVAKLAIPDLLADRRLSSSELAARTGTHEPSLYRVLRTLASLGVFAETADRTFELTPMAELLRTDVPNSMRDFAIMQGEEWGWRSALELLHTVKTGEPALVKVHGMTLFEFLARHPEDEELFNRAMTSYSLAAIPAIVEAYDFSTVGTLVDVGGGYGSLLAGVLTANPQVRGVLFDAPSVIDGADELLTRAGVAERVEKLAGDFFHSVPPGAGAYIMKNIIHDWDDDQAVKILTNTCAAMSANGKVLVVDLLISEGNQPGPEKLVDVQMLVSTRGKERTAAEFGELLAAAGLRLTQVIPTRSPMNIIEAVRA